MKYYPFSTIYISLYIKISIHLALRANKEHPQIIGGKAAAGVAIGENADGIKNKKSHSPINTH